MATTHEKQSTLRSILYDTVERHPERPAITYRVGGDHRRRGRDGQSWRTLTWHEIAYLVLDVAAALDRSLGTRTTRTVAILADTDARYPLLELAVGLTGRVLQPVYVSSTDEEIKSALQVSGADVLVVGRSQAERVLAGQLHPGTIELDTIVRLPGIGDAPYAALPPDVEPFETRGVLARLAQLPPRAPLAPLLYMQSTGTTGPARVIEISERALIAAVRAVQGEASHQFPRLLSFLPTAHISERLLTLYVSIALAGHTFYGGGLDALATDLRSCRPTILLAPPLLLETIRAEAQAAARSTRVGRKLLASVQRTADAMLAGGVVGRGRRSLGARLFGFELRRGAGLDELRDALTGTAPMPATLHAWFEAVGIPLRIVYGQTELAGATSITTREGATFGSVGALVPGVETRISERGELLVRAESAFTGYVGDAAATARTLDCAWFHSGDRATLSASGEIVLQGRVQSVIEARDGTAVDTAQIAAQVRKGLGNVEIAFARDATTGETHMYLATCVSTPGAPPAEPVPDTDVRWERLAEAVVAADPHRAVSGWALFEGAFTQATGEVGPTGKARGWRIHALRSKHLHLRARGAAAAKGVAPRRDNGAAGAFAIEGVHALKRRS
jgi:long-chain acyl-CoA synthetase